MAGPYGVPGVFFESVSAVTSTPSVELGTRRTENGDDYIYCYNGSTNEQLTKGRGAIQTAASGFTVNVASLAITTFLCDIPVAFCKNATLTTGQYGWLLTRGSMDVENFGLTSIAAGEQIHLHQSGTVSRQTAPTATVKYMVYICGRALGAQTTTTTGTFSATVWTAWA